VPTDGATIGSPRVEARRARTTRAILDAAWQLSAESGLESLSLREIGASVGMRAPSLYGYFSSKAAILDALFADGYARLTEETLAAVAELPPRAPARRRLGQLLHTWIRFCQNDPARYRLMFTMVVPGWEPSESAYAASLAYSELLGGQLALAGITDPDDLDLATAIGAGLVAQQMANDPDGDRWSRRVDDAVDMLLRHTASRARRAVRPDEGES
jgi:AcrR family transcriptional regulator